MFECAKNSIFRKKPSRISLSLSSPQLTRIFDPPQLIICFHVTNYESLAQWFVSWLCTKIHSHRSCWIWMICRNALHMQQTIEAGDFTVPSASQQLSYNPWRSWDLVCLLLCANQSSFKGTNWTVWTCQADTNLIQLVFKKLIISRFHFFIFEAKTTPDFGGHHTKGLASK